jgi:peptidoglycan/LPS O-acetylase OafA/YrhL
MNEAGTAKAKREAFVIPSLDGIRALSFMVVFLAHAGMPYIPGGFGVTVFFFLSGYLITTLLRREAEATGTISFKLFYLRRALRILPPFYIILGLALLCALTGLVPTDISWPGFAAQALHYSNYWVVQRGWDGLIGGTGVYWSLAVEEHFYLLFPALYALLLRSKVSPRAQHAILFALCAVIMLWRAKIVFHDGIIGDRTYVASDTRFDSMLFGCALAVWGNPAMDFEKGKRASVLELAAAAVGVALLLVTFLVRDPAFRESIRYSIQGIALYPLFFVAVRHPNLLFCRFLNLRWVRFFGTLSYSLYLVHQIVIHVVMGHVPLHPLLQGALCLAISVLLSYIIWRYIEKPCAKLRSKLSTAPPSATALQAQGST